MECGQSIESIQRTDHVKYRNYRQLNKINNQQKNDGYLTQASFASVNTLISGDEQDDTMLSMKSKKEDLNYKKNYQKTTHNSQQYRRWAHT